MKLLFVLMLFTGSIATADTDYTCLNQCTAAGNQYGLCQSKCSYTPSTGFGSFSDNKQTDYQCVSRCTQGGSLYNFCVDKCSY